MQASETKTIEYEFALPMKLRNNNKE